MFSRNCAIEKENTAETICAYWNAKQLLLLLSRKHAPCHSDSYYLLENPGNLCWLFSCFSSVVILLPFLPSIQISCKAISGKLCRLVHQRAGGRPWRNKINGVVNHHAAQYQRKTGIRSCVKSHPSNWLTAVRQHSTNFPSFA